jgi:hypothetical protein
MQEIVSGPATAGEGDRVREDLGPGRGGDLRRVPAQLAAARGALAGRRPAAAGTPGIAPAGYPLAGKLAARIELARAEQAAGDNPLGLVFPAPAGKHWRSSNFRRNVMTAAYLAAGWRDAAGKGAWTSWPATPTTASPSTCTSAPSPASSTGPAPPPNNQRKSGGSFTKQTAL